MEEEEIKLEELKKVDIKNSSNIFKNEILLNEDRINRLKEIGEKNNFENLKELRPLAWKIFLGIIPEESKSIEEWIDTIDSQRTEYKNKLEKYCSLEKYRSIDPLLNNEDTEKEDLLNKDEDKSILNLINLDLVRTHQNIDLFQKNKTKNILSNILYIYSKGNYDIPYGQGMNELVSMLYICLYPYYLPKKENHTKEEIKEYLKDIDSHYEDIYLYFHDEDELQSDIFYLFESIMLKGIKDLYGKDDVKKDDKNYNIYELFPDIIKDLSNEERPIPLNLRSSLVIKEKLKVIDIKLYNHFKRININCNYFLHRWFKCIFTREFDINDVSCLWDKIFLYEYTKSKLYKYPLVYMDFICVAMIIKIRSKLIKKDENDCFTILFHYPKGEDISELIDISEKISEVIENKLNGEKYNTDEVFELIKDNIEISEEESNDDDEAKEELIITPHMYNQSNDKGFISCDKKKENIIFCGKYYIKKKYLLVFIFCLLLFMLLILIYNKFQFNNK